MDMFLCFNGMFCIQKMAGLSDLLNICDLFSGSLNLGLVGIGHDAQV